MKVCDLFEAEKKDSEKNLLPVDAIAMMLFREKAGIIKDPKRDKDKNYLGVSHTKSTIKGPGGKALFLTFDNSTDSGGFEIDSFTPLKIEKGDDLDRAIKKLFDKHELTRGSGYVVKSDATYLRELALGKKLGRPAVKLVADIIKLFKAGEEEVPEEEKDAEDLKKDTSKEKPKAKKEEPKPKKEEPKPKKEEPKEEKPAPKKEEKAK